MLRKIRISLAIVCFVAIIILFCDRSEATAPYLSWLPSIQFVPAVLACHWAIVSALVIVTLLLGRVYCSVICPMGVLQDIISRLHTRRGRMRFRYHRSLTWLRVAMLVIFVALILAGFTAIAALIEPYSAFGRMVTAVAIGSPWPLLVIAGVTLVVIGTMAWIGGREYCNTICPVGTVLGFLSRFAWLAPVIDTSRCNGCKRCARQCKSSCIDPESHTIDYSRCVACMDCIDACSTGAISYTIRPRGAREEKPEKPDGDRRKFVAMVGAVAAASAAKAIAKTTDSGLAEIVPKQAPTRSGRLVPPGAVSLRHLQQHCTSCQLCITKCPDGVLRPRISLDGLLQPEMSYETGYCRPECTACADVCPDNAILPIDAPAKSGISIGRAVVDADMCLSATGREDCHACSSRCPSGAIIRVERPDGGKLPVVNESACLGCGACEYLCPVRPVSAIHVEGYDTHLSV